MKLAVSNIAWPIEKEAECLQIMKQHGFNYLEVAPTKYWPDLTQVTPSQITERRQIIEQSGLSVCSAQALLFGRPELSIFGDDRVKNETVDYLKMVIDICSALGAQRLVFGSPKNRLKAGRTFDQAKFEAAEVFRTLGDYCVRKNVILCIEPNSKKYGCDFVTNVDEAIAVVDAVKSSGFGLHLDTGNMLMEGDDFTQCFLKSVDLVRHFHISAPYLKPIQNVNDDFDELVWLEIGGLQVVKTVEMLLEKNQDLCLELEGNLRFVKTKLKC